MKQHTSGVERDPARPASASLDAGCEQTLAIILVEMRVTRTWSVYSEVMRTWARSRKGC